MFLEGHADRERGDWMDLSLGYVSIFVLQKFLYSSDLLLAYRYMMSIPAPLGSP